MHPIDIVYSKRKNFNFIAHKYARREETMISGSDSEVPHMPMIV